jgi:phosphoribosylglycinamide formyltransferase-1
MANLKVVLLASGSGTLAQAIFDAKLDLTFLALVSDKDSEALIRASNELIPTKLLPMQGDRTIWNRELIEYVSSLNPDLVVSVGFMRILPPEFVSKFPTINTHPALLPQFPGAHAVRDAIAAGATVTGSTVHWVDSGVDTGKIITQEEVLISAGESEDSLHERIKIVERKLIVETLKKFITDGIPEHN